MLLHFVIRLLSLQNIPNSTYAWCQEALENYFNLCEELYGDQFLSYNVHGLLHIVDDVARLGPLESYSAFCYENNMPGFRKYIRKPHLTLQQLHNRICELNDVDLAPIDNRIHLRASQNHAEGPLLQHLPVHLCRQFRKLKLGNITFSTSLRDSYCILNNGEICIIMNIVQMEGSTIFIVKQFLIQIHLYDVGKTSDLAGVFQCSNVSDVLEAIKLTDVKGKVYRIQNGALRKAKKNALSKMNGSVYH